MFKRIALGLVVTLAAVLGLAAPAQAAWSCPYQSVCFYWGYDGVGSEAAGTEYVFTVTMPAGANWTEIYVGEPVRSNAHSMKNNYVNRYINRRYTQTSCSYAYQGVYIPYTGGHNFNPYTTCFRINWV